jgi:hypothetical protein
VCKQEFCGYKKEAPISGQQTGARTFGRDCMLSNNTIASPSKAVNSAARNLSQSGISRYAGLRVEVLAFKPYVKNTMQGWVDLLLPSVGIKLVGCTVHQKNGSRWIGLPAREYQDGGVRKWAPIVENVSKGAREAFQQAALAALDGFQFAEGANS